MNNPTQGYHRIIYRRWRRPGHPRLEKTIVACRSRRPGGQFCIYVYPQMMHDAAKRAGFFAAHLLDNWRVLLGMAGLEAEEILRDETDDAEIIADNISVRILLGYSSESDLLMMGITNIEDLKLNYEEVEHALRYLKEEWQLVREYAECHIAEALAADESVVSPKAWLRRYDQRK